MPIVWLYFRENPATTPLFRLWRPRSWLFEHGDPVVMLVGEVEVVVPIECQRGGQHELAVSGAVRPEVSVVFALEVAHADSDAVGLQRVGPAQDVQAAVAADGEVDGVAEPPSLHGDDADRMAVLHGEAGHRASLRPAEASFLAVPPRYPSTTVLATSYRAGLSQSASSHPMSCSIEAKHLFMAGHRDSSLRSRVVHVAASGTLEDENTRPGSTTVRVRTGPAVTLRPQPKGLGRRAGSIGRVASC